MLRKLTARLTSQPKDSPTSDTQRAWELAYIEISEYTALVIHQSGPGSIQYVKCPQMEA